MAIRAPSETGHSLGAGASVRQKNGCFYDGRSLFIRIIRHFRGRPTGFQAN